MKVQIKSPRANKRKIVVPFTGEENFIVPKEGGFGHPDNDEWISVESKYANLTAPISTNSPSNEPTTQTGTGLGTGTIAQGNTTTTHVSTPTTTTQSSSTSTSGTDTTTITPTLTQPVSTTPTTSTGTTSNEGITPPLLDTGTIPPKPKSTISTPKSSIVPTESITSLPTFPDYSTLDCSALQSEISRIQLIVSAGGLTTEVANAYNTALATAKSTYTSKCNIPSPAPVIIAPVPTPAVGGGFHGGGGGGGIGEPPADETATTEQTDTTSGSGKSWLFILALIGGLYFLTKSGK